MPLIISITKTKPEISKNSTWFDNFLFIMTPCQHAIPSTTPLILLLPWNQPHPYSLVVATNKEVNEPRAATKNNPNSIWNLAEEEKDEGFGENGDQRIIRKKKDHHNSSKTSQTHSWGRGWPSARSFGRATRSPRTTSSSGWPLKSGRQVLSLDTLWTQTTSPAEVVLPIPRIF